VIQTGCPHFRRQSHAAGGCVRSTLPPASQVASQIALGWNIGNSLEAIGGETAWGNPAVNQQLINSVLPGQTNGFALFNRSNGAVVDQGALDAVRRGAGGGSSNNFALTVTKAGTGSGAVTSSPSGNNCGTTCATNYSSGTSVALSATAASGSTFFDGRTITVGGQARTCSQMPLTRSADGYYYFSVSGGTYPWAGLYSW
jgi:hypothetical protein